MLLSHDVFSYVAYARLGVLHGIDPYVRGPAAAPGDPVFAEVAWQHTTSAYGPLFTLATYPLAWLGVGGAVAALKAAAALSVLGIAALVARLAAWRGADPLRAAVLVALNPLVLVHVVGGAHNDGLMMLLSVLAVAAILARREASGGAALVAAVAVKLTAAFLAPFALLAAITTGRKVESPVPTGRKVQPVETNRPVGTGGWTFRPVGRLLAGMAGATLAVGVAAQVAFGWEWLDALNVANENQGRTSHLSIPATAARLSGLGDGVTRAAALVLFAALVVWLAVWTWRGGDWVRAAAWAAFGLLLATSWLLPWYLIWALPLVAISRDRPLLALMLALTAFQLGARIPL